MPRFTRAVKGVCSVDKGRQVIDHHTSLRLLDAYIRIPTVSDDISASTLADVAGFWQNIDLTAELLFPRSETTDLVVPALFFEIPADVPDAPTLLLYGHWDVQPPGDETRWEWQGNVCSPFTPSYITGTSFFRELSQLIDDPAALNRAAIIGRGTADNKGQHLANMIGVVNAKRRGKLAWNIKVILDGEEERGSPHLSSIVLDNITQLRADVMVGSDGPKTDNRPTLILGGRGLLELDIRCKNDWSYAPHSGNYGNIARNPVLHLAQLLCELESSAASVDVRERDNVALAIESHQHQFSGDRSYVPFLKSTFNVHSFLSDGASLTHPRTIIPRWAHARVDIRLVPGVFADDILASFDPQIARWRERHPDLHLEMRVTQKTEGSYTPPSAFGFSWLHSVFKTFWIDEDPITIPIAGGTLPEDIFTQGLGMPSYWLPAANSDNFQHDANEHLFLHHYLKQQALYEELVSTPLN